MKLPRRKPGYQPEAAKVQYEEEVKAFCAVIRELHSSLRFAASARGYAYFLEGLGKITKGEFDTAEKLIGDCRKNGSLPYDIVAADETRRAVSFERLSENGVEDEAASALDTLRNWHVGYTPFSFWDDQDVYIEMAVEKNDVRNLFIPPCGRFQVHIINLKGWCDITERVRMLKRFKRRSNEGKRCKLLAFVDHDPSGLQISKFLRENLKAVAHPAGCSPDSIGLEIIRVGLTKKQIDDLGLLWIENLETASGDDLSDPSHHDHNKDYVQNYIREFGARKVEANALMAHPAAAQQLCLDIIHQYLSDGAVEDHEARLEEVREELKDCIAELMREEFED
jgi:hypothetical protein